MKSIIKSLDIFPKAAEGSTRRTSEGGIVSVIAILIGFFLILGEVSRILEKPFTEKLILADRDKHELDNVKLEIEIIFYALHCKGIKVELFSNGDRARQTDVTKLVDLIPIPKKGQQQQQPGNAESGDGDDDDGCIVKGKLDSPKQSGNLHVTLVPHALEGAPIQGITLSDFSSYNASHELKKIRFFSESNDMTTGKLDGTKNINHVSTAYFLYNLHVVPVVAHHHYHQDDNNRYEIIQSNSNKISKRFPYNFRMKTFEATPNEVMAALNLYGMPGLFIEFEFSPLILERSPSQQDYTQFFIRLIGICGGLTMIVSLFDTIIHLGIEPLKRKLD
jgi:hypothetical protein